MNTRFILLVTAISLNLSAMASDNAKTLIKKVKKASGIEVVFQSSYKGRTLPGTRSMTIVGTEVVLKRNHADEPEAKGSLTSTDYQDWVTKDSRRMAILPSGRIINTTTPFKTGEGYVKILDDDTVLGLPCHVWRYNVNSNTIDVWWTEALEGYKGTPQTMNGNAPDGVVLKIVRNGDLTQEAIAINTIKNARPLFPDSWGDNLEAYEYSYECNHCYDINVNIFDQQAVRFSQEKLQEPSTLKEGVQYIAGGGTIILKKVKLPVNAHDYDVFARLTQYSVGDAYDRLGSVFVIPTDKEQSFLDAMHALNSVPSFHSGDTDYHGLISTDKYTVPVELMRFFTGFGVRKFNYIKEPGREWADSVTYDMNVSPLVDYLKDEVWIGAYIGNWDANGHKISLTLTYHPTENDTASKRRALPLFNTVNILEQDGQPYPTFMLNDNLKTTFHLDKPVNNAKLYYITSGHGGWERGDEFNQKINTIMLDGQKVISFIPWRDDCATYRNNSPCSGNFSNGLSSSDLSRSNWCPGTVTNPEYIYLGNLDAGNHTITVEIPQGAPEGGSNSYWCLSGTIIYNE